MFRDLEETSQTLEEEREFLWKMTQSNKDEILTSLSNPSEELRKELSDQLKILQNSAEDSD